MSSQPTWEHTPTTLPQQATGGKPAHDLIAALRTEIERLKAPKPNITSRDGEVSFSFTAPHATAFGGGLLHFWTVAHLEAVLLHLRMNGAGDDTPVRTHDSALRCKMDAAGFNPNLKVPSAEKEEPALEEMSRWDELREKVVAARTFWFVLGMVGTGLVNVLHAQIVAF